MLRSKYYFMEGQTTMKKNCIVSIIVLFHFVAVGQIDTTGFVLSDLTQYELELKQNWDLFLAQGGDWSELLQNKQYSLDCKRIFIFEYLVRLGIVDTNTEIGDMDTFFSHGCRCGNSYLVEKGLSLGVDINRPYREGMTALMLCVQSKNLHNMYMVLNNKPDLHLINSYGDNILCLSAQYLSDTSIINFFLENNVEIRQRNNLGYNALEIAYFWNDDKIFNFILSYCLNKCKSDFWNTSRLVEMAIISGDTLLLREMLPICVSKSKNEDYLTLAWKFAQYYNLLNKYRDPSPDTTSRLYNTQDLDIGVFSALLDCGYNINTLDSLNQNVLFKCKDILPVAKYLVKNNININQVDIFGKTTLQYFIDEIIDPPRFEFGLVLKKLDRDYTEELEFLRFYIENGAVVGKDNKNGWHYIYDCAKQKGNTFLLKYLDEKYAKYLK